MAEWEVMNMQPVSIYEYSQVGDLQVEEDWLKRSKNIIEYRQNLYQAFADSQQRYLKRRNEKRIQNQVENLIAMKEQVDFHSVDPKNPSLALQKRKLVKESRGNIRRDIERWFVIDNFLITFFKKEGDKDFKKNAPLESAYVLVEQFGDSSEYRWHDRSKQYRVQIRLSSRAILPVFYYTDDLHEAQMIVSRVFMASSQKQDMISLQIRKVCVIESILRFRALWQRVFTVYNNRLLKMISFQIMGINLIELANTGWFQREKLFKFWSGQILKREKIPLLRSTFRFGEIRKKLDPSIYKSSLLVREQLRKIVNAFKNRRLQRHSAIQQDINTLLEEEEQGFQINDVTLKHFNQNGDVTYNHQFKQGNAKIDQHTFLQLEKLNDSGLGATADFYERNPPIKYFLEHISLMATNCNPFDKTQEEFKVRVYGRKTSEVSSSTITTNLSPHEVGYDILRRQPQEIYQIKIHSIELAIKLAQKFSLKADLRVRVKQARTLDQFDQQPYYINSRPYRISVPPNRDKGRMIIKGNDYTFTIDKLDPSNPDEVFQLYIVLQRNSVPVTQFMKEFLYEEEFMSKKYFPFAANEKLEAKVSDSQDNKMKITFSISKINSQEALKKNIYPNEREGKRIMVGRYALYKRRIVIVRQVNKDHTVNLQYLLKPEKWEQNVKISKLRQIERQGVSVFDINLLPSVVEQSSYQWVLEFTAKNKRLINIINSSIQNRQVNNSFEQREFFRDVKRDIEGQIFVSVIEALNIKLNSKNCNSQVRLTVLNQEKGDRDQNQNSLNGDLYFETTIKEQNNQPNWISTQFPSGEIFCLGNFFKEESKSVKFELINKRSGFDGSDSIIGEATMTIQELIDIDEPGKEICIILENRKDNTYTFLVIQSLFVSNNVTRIEYQLIKDLSIFVAPEEHFHQMFLQNQYQLDQFAYNVPLGSFYPNYLEKQLQKKADNQLAQSKQKQSESLSTLDKVNVPGICLAKSKLCSPEEKLSIALKYKDMLRPEIEEGVMIFKYLWKFRVFQSRHTAYNELQNRFWVKFMLDMSLAAAAHPYIHQIQEDENSSDVNFDTKSFMTVAKPQQQNINQQAQALNQNQGGNDLLGWFKSKALGQEASNVNDNQSVHTINRNQRQTVAKTEKFKLLFHKIWENEDGQQYADTYYLVQSGIPPQLRVKIWKDLLKVPVLEWEEIQSFKRAYGEDQYDDQISIYENIKDYARRHDCLAFRQIDEDIEYYRFPRLFHEDDQHQEKVAIQRENKSKMRNILRALIFWSRNKKLDNKIVSYSYNKGILHILQRLITFANEEDSFWILNGFIRAIPRLFSTDISCLEGGRNSAMRNEMTAFKAILRENLPNICDKLRLLGLPVDILIYDSMTSFYSHFFSSDVVLRLWDQIIFGFSNNDKIARKRALWYFMSPAYLILREKQDDIMNANSTQQVIDIYNNGCALTYNPDWVASELKILIRDTFVTGMQRFQDEGKSKLSLGIMMRGTNQVDKAKMLEQTRKNFEADLSMIFNSIEEENKQVGLLLEKTNFSYNPKNPQYLDYVRWRQHVMARFKKVALKDHGDGMLYDDLYEYEEPEMNRENMDLSKINVYLHQIQNLTGVRLFKLRLLYGRIVPDLQVLEERYSDDVCSDPNVNQYQAFEYMSGYNQIKIEILDNQNDDAVVCEMIIDLRELNVNRFIKKYYQMRNEYFVENVDSYRSPFTVFTISFFLQTHTSEQHQELMKSRNTQMSQFINSIKRKLPDRIDIFNKKNETEFVEIMKGDFKRIIREEFDALSNFLPEQQARNTINDNFNFIEDSDFGNITLENLEYLVRQCFFSDWLPYLGQLYKIFVKEEEENKEEEDKLETDGSLDREEENAESKGGFNLFSKILNKKPEASIQSKPQLMQRKKNFELEGRVTIKQRSKLPFSLRNFIVSLVLMSHCTVNEKFDILYDLFDWNDGVADGLDMNAMFMLIKTIFERNLYYWPSHELFNLVETAFDLSVSSIYQAFWTREPIVQSNKKSLKLKDLLLMKKEQIMKAASSNNYSSDNDELASIDVTDELLENINSYQRMFGTKIIDFNADSSAFKNIDNLIKGGSKLLEVTNQIGGKYRLVIFYQVSSERYSFEVEYNQQGQLSKNRELEEKDDIDEYLKRNVNKLYLQGRSKGISKKEFLLKTEQIPFLQDLIRIETLYRDRFQSTLQPKKKLDKELIILINEDDMMFVFRFQSRVKSNIEGDVQMIDKSTFRVLMAEAYEQDTVSDIRERINAVMTQLASRESRIKPSHLLQLKGVKEFFIKEEINQAAKNGVEASKQWRKVNEYDRLIEFLLQKDQPNGQGRVGNNQKEIILKMEYSKHQGEDIFMNSKEEERDLAGFDCYSLYKHNDNSYEWRLCKIMQKEPIVEGANKLGISQYSSAQKNISAAALDAAIKDDNQQKFFYWIEFLHHRKTGQKLWLKRRREEILMSARYAREQQRNYEQESLKFIQEIYGKSMKLAGQGKVKQAPQQKQEQPQEFQNQNLAKGQMSQRKL